jgi:hypothetical protein
VIRPTATHRFQTRPILSLTGLIVLRVVGFFMISIGVLAAYGAIRLRMKLREAHLWPTVTGTILASPLESKTERSPGQKPIKTCAAAIRYAYEVDGKAYESDQVQLGGTSETGRPGSFKRMVEHYDEGQRVQVSYDPADPATATLEPGEAGGILNMAVVAGGFILVGGVVVTMTFVAA